MREEKYKEKLHVLNKIILSLKEIYDESNENQRSLIETIIGAEIFYLTQAKKYYSGKISLKCKENHNLKVKEHMYPRKHVAKMIFNELFNKIKEDDDYISNILDKYGKWNYVTKDENQELKKINKKNFNDPEESYNACGIELIDDV